MTADSIQDLRSRDRIDIVRETDDGEEEELTVFNWVNTAQFKEYRGSNPTMSSNGVELGAGDSPMKPDAVTKWVADSLASDNIDPRRHDIEVIDLENDDIDIYW